MGKFERAEALNRQLRKRARRAHWARQWRSSLSVILGWFGVSHLAS